ncbi:hypothetical protein L21SP2_1897 [Salinispira pacifica]|uniref:Uncharacterized protein n=1 Tax=Salinispira pacifica TaxID=1307761 RepID=V5WI22_9SPIO|nr:hypothetical protein L21SP2_1897 [Salinispira pacifica]
MKPIPGQPEDRLFSIQKPLFFVLPVSDPSAHQRTGKVIA